MGEGVRLMSLDSPASCDYQGCKAVRQTVNHWFVGTEDLYGVHIYRWETCPEEAMKNGKHFCGIEHALRNASSVLTPDTTDRQRESTLELKPPLTREGTVPEQQTEQETEKE